MDSQDFSKALSSIDGSLSQFIQERQQATDSFVENHFSLQQAIEIQKKSVLVDLVFYPINTLWAIPYLSLKKSIETLDKLGWMKFNGFLEILPPGFKTHSQKETEKLLASEYLQIPRLVEASTTPLQALLTQEELARVEQRITAECHKEIDKYTASQNLISDLSTSVLTLLAGRLFFGDGSLDLFGIGSRIAKKIARDQAADNFFLGKGLGSVFYSVVPVEPSRTQILLSTLGVGLLLTCFSVAAAVLSDPVRKKLGLHNKRLSSLLTQLEERIFLAVKNELKSTRPTALRDPRVG